MGNNTNLLLRLLFLSVLLPIMVKAQVAAPAKAKYIEIDLLYEEVKGAIPYDAPFVFTGVVPDKTITKLEFYFAPGICSGGNTIASYVAGYVTDKRPLSVWRRQIPYERIPAGTSDKFYLIFGISDSNDWYLLPNKDYCAVIVGYSEAIDPTTKEKKYTPVLYSVFTLNAESSLSDHVKLDFGVGYAFKPQTTIGVSSVHFYLAAINEDTDLGDENIRLDRRFFLKTSIFAGISPIVINSGAKQDIQNRFGLGNFVYGIGIRSPLYGPSIPTGRFGRMFLQPMRLNIGNIIFKQDDANPIVNKARNKTALFVGITYDFNITTILGPITKLIAIP